MNNNWDLHKVNAKLSNTNKHSKIKIKYKILNNDDWKGVKKLYREILPNWEHNIEFTKDFKSVSQYRDIEVKDTRDLRKVKRLYIVETKNRYIGGWYQKGWVISNNITNIMKTAESTFCWDRFMVSEGSKRNIMIGWKEYPIRNINLRKWTKVRIVAMERKEQAHSLFSGDNVYNK